MDARRGRREYLARWLGSLVIGALACGGIAGGANAATGAPEPLEPLAIEERTHTLVGSYLAGRFARSQQDTLRAADYYRTALAQDPGNPVLLEQSFLMETSQGNWPQALALAKDLLALQPQNRIANSVLAVAAFKEGRYADADKHFAAGGTTPIGELTSSLARAWVKVGEGDAQGASDQLEAIKQQEWAQLYVTYHRALINDVLGRTVQARAAFDRIDKQGAPRTLRNSLAYARHLAAFGDTRLAKIMLKELAGKSPGEGHPLVRDLHDRIEAGERVGLLVPDAAEGIAEVFYGLGEAIMGEGGVSLGVAYLQIALYLSPQHNFALAALAAGYEAAKRYQEALAVYERIPKGSPLEASIEVHKAVDLNLLDRPDEAKALLDRVVERDPNDIKTLNALGNIMRARKRYEEAVDYYSRAIALLPKAEKQHWEYFYSRGTCYERLKNWPKAEADLVKAMQLFPEQPMVLNYLGYSWIDQNRNLKQGMQLIERAVQMKQDDGYIVDSLGWAHYRQGNFKEAVRHLERAVVLRPEDPVLNDHLGDALWRVGRLREARFQWDQSLSLNPEPDDAEKIRKKLLKGLPPVVPVQTVRRGRDADLGNGRKRETKLAPSRPVVE